MSAPRRPCPVCSREIAVVSGRYARHDPPGRRARHELVSCPGSLKTAPSDARQPASALFGETAVEDSQQRLF